MTNKNLKKIDIGCGDLDLCVDGQLILHIGQVSDDEVVNLYLYPKDGGIVESLIYQMDPDHGCTHEVLTNRKKGE
jgi:hypothetical protein